MQRLTRINPFKPAAILAAALCLATQFAATQAARSQQFAPSPFAAQFAQAESGSSQQAATLPPAPSKWANVVSLDLTLTRGNSRNFLATTTINSTRKTAEDELLLGASAGYGDTTQTVAGEG